MNGGDHDHGYTALHFAALSNAVGICQDLLSAGIKEDRLNAVNRTAAQMAGFVGNSDCVCVINNHVPKEAVFFYTRKQPLETEAKLPLQLAKPIYSLVSCVRTTYYYFGLRSIAHWMLHLDISSCALLILNMER